MRFWHIAVARLRSVFFRDRREADLGEELRYHLDRETERLVGAGLDPVTARQRARREFGAVEKLKEESRDARGTTFVDHLVRDTRHAARRLRRDWRFTIAAVLILGLGIGVNAAIFSVINAVLFRPQAVVNPDTLVDIYQNASGGAPTGSSYAAYLDMAAYTDIFAASTVTFIPHPVTYADGREHVALLLVGARTASLAWTVVHRDRGHLERASRGRSRLPRVDDPICLRPRGRGAHHPDRWHAGHGGGRRSGESRGGDELRRSYRLLDAAQDTRGVRRPAADVGP